MEWLTEAVIAQIVATIGVVLAAGIPAYLTFKSKLTEIGEDAAEAREQTKNPHSENIREEMDARHELIIGTLAEVTRDIRGIRRDNLETREDIGQLRAEDRAGRRDTHQLRNELREHIRDTEPLLPALEWLISRHAPEHLPDYDEDQDPPAGPKKN